MATISLGSFIQRDEVLPKSKMLAAGGENLWNLWIACGRESDVGRVGGPGSAKPSPVLYRSRSLTPLSRRSPSRPSVTGGDLVLSQASFESQSARGFDHRGV